MASWSIECPNCMSNFNYSAIDDAKLESFYFPLKPDFPAGGSELQCPHCGHKAKYQSADLFYQA
jgi:hypothetical protein